MSKFDRGAFFSIGLVAGVSLALFFFVWAFPWFVNPHMGHPDCPSGDQKCVERSETSDDAHFWIQPFHGWIYTEDTLAQWMMAVLSLLATGFSGYAVLIVRDTLDETRRGTAEAIRASDAAIENNKIVLADQRPWLVLSIDIRHVDMAGDWFTAKGDLVIKNIGRTAAHAVSLVGAYPFGESVIEKRSTILDRARKAETIYYVLPGQEIRRQLFFERDPIGRRIVYITAAASYKWGEGHGFTSNTWSAVHLRKDGSMGLFDPHGAYKRDEILIREIHESSIVE